MLGKSAGLYVERMDGVEITTSTVRRMAAQDCFSEPRMQSVHPLSKLPRTSQTHISKAMFNSWATRIPGCMPRFPGGRQSTAKQNYNDDVYDSRGLLQLITLPCVTSTPFGFPVVPGTDLSVIICGLASKSDLPEV